MCQMAKDHLDDKVADRKEQYHVQWYRLTALQYLLDGHLDLVRAVSRDRCISYEWRLQGIVNELHKYGTTTCFL